MTSLRAAYTAAEAQLATDPLAALSGFVSIAAAAPDFWPARFRIVDALLLLDEVDATEAVLRGLASGYARNGQPMQAILACKLLESCARDSDSLASEISLIYAGLIGQDLVPNAQQLELANTEAPPSCPRENAIAEARALGYLEERQPERYPAIPLLSRLTPEDFIVVLRALKLHRVGPSARIVTQGAVGASCFLVAEGTLIVSRHTAHEDKVLGRLHSGTIFGEMALVSKRPRNATITSLGSSTVFELTRATLLAHSKAMREALYAFSRRRLLENITLTSPLLQPLPRDVRQAVVGLFGSFPIHTGQVLVREAERGQGLFVVLRGAVRVMKHKDGKDVELARLTEGELFGEISLLRDTPTTASVIGAEDGEVLFLDRSDFTALVSKYPQVQSTLAALSDERLRTSELILENLDDEDALSVI